MHHIKPNLLALAVTGIAPALETLERWHDHALPAPDDAPAAVRQALQVLLRAVERTLEELPAELSA